jgi:hypothetical protein
MRATYALELGSTAECETSWFHALLAGKTAQPPTVEPPRATTWAGAAGCGTGGAGRGAGGRVAAALIGTGVGRGVGDAARLVASEGQPQRDR